MSGGDCYRLPDGNVQIAFSGGRTSAFMLHQILERNGTLPDRVVVSFQNTGREMPETLDFVQEVGERWGVRVVWLEYRPNAPRFEVVSHNSASRNGEPFAALVRKRRYLPNRVARFCTAELKVHCATRYARSMGWEKWVKAVGIRADEMRRVKGQPRERFTIWHPLVAAGVTKRHVVQFWQAQPFDLRLLNIKGTTPRGNCDGCFLKSEANLASLARDHPERHQWWEDQEASISELIGRGGGAAWCERYTRKELREAVERQGDWLFENDSALCQAEDGECMA